MLGVEFRKVEWLRVESCGRGISTDGNVEFSLAKCRGWELMSGLGNEKANRHASSVVLKRTLPLDCSPRL